MQHIGRKLIAGKLVAAAAVCALCLSPAGNARAEGFDAGEIAGLLDGVAAGLGIESAAPAPKASGSPKANVAREQSPAAPAPAPSGGVVAEVERMRRENATLKERVAATEAKIASLERKSSVAQPRRGESGDTGSLASEVASMRKETAALKKALEASEARTDELQKNMARLTGVVAKLAQKFIGG